MAPKDKLIKNSERELQENVILILKEILKAEMHCRTKLNELIHEFIMLQVQTTD